AGFQGSTFEVGLQLAAARGRGRTAAIALRLALLLATVVATTVVQAAEEATATAVVVARVVAGVVARSSRGRSNLTADHAADVDNLFAGDADANGAGRLARNLAGFVLGAFHNALLGHALIRADLDLLFFPRHLANRNLARNAFGHADLLAH